MNKFIKWVGRGLSLKFPKIYGSIYGTLSHYLNLYDVNEERYTRTLENNDVVWSIASSIADGVGKARWFLRSKSTKKEVHNERFEHLKKKAGPQESLADVFKLGTFQKLGYGNVYYVGEKGTGINKDYLQFLFVAPSENMTVNGGWKGIKAYIPSTRGSVTDEIPATNVMHLRNVRTLSRKTSSNDWFKGQSPLEAALPSVQAYDESRKAGVFFTQNKGAQKALILDPNVTMSPEEETKFNDKLRETAQGPTNTGNIIPLIGVKDVLDISSDPKKALVLEQRIQAKQEICDVFKFPSSLVGVQNNTYQNAKEAKKAKWEDCIIPELDEIKEGFNRWALGEFGEDLELCYDISHIDALREDRPVQDLAGISTRGEARLRVGLPLFGDKRDEEDYLGFVQGVKDNGKTNETESDEEKD